MDWENLRNKIYYQDGSLRDIYIHNSTQNDWQLWADFVNTNYKTTFFFSEPQTKMDKVDLTKVFDYWNGVMDNLSTATVFIDTIQLNAHFFTKEEIENDISPSQINSVDEHNKLLDYMTRLSRALNKKVILTPENEPDFVLISVDKDVVKINI